jgi:hypothetical protein
MLLFDINLSVVHNQRVRQLAPEELPMLDELLERTAQLGFWNYYYLLYLRMNSKVTNIDPDLIIKPKI